MTEGPCEFTVKILEQITLVRYFGEGIENGQPMDFLVILRLDIAAGQEAEEVPTATEIVPVIERSGAYANVIDKGAVGAVKIDDDETFSFGLDACMAARQGHIIERDRALAAPSQNNLTVGKGIAGAHSLSGGIDTDQASERPIDTRGGALGREDKRFLRGRRV